MWNILLILSYVPCAGVSCAKNIFFLNFIRFFTLNRWFLHCELEVRGLSGTARDIVIFLTKKFALVVSQRSLVIMR